MAPRDDIGRRFSEDIERLTRGHSAETRDTDYEATLQFAQRLISLKDTPDPAFAFRLREDLMLKMAQQDAEEHAKERPPLLVRLFGGHTVRLAVVSTFIVIAALGLVWRAGLLSPLMPAGSDEAPSLMQEGPPEAAEEAAPEDGEAESPDMIRAAGDAEEDAEAAPAVIPVVVRAEVTPAVVHGDDIRITLFFENTGQDGMTLEPFPPAVMLKDLNTGTVVYTFAAGDSTTALSPMESMQYDLTWDQTDHDGRLVAPGQYAVDVGHTSATPAKNGVFSLEAAEVAIIEIVAE